MPQPLSDQQLLEILSLSPSPTAVYITADAIIQWANQAMLGFLGKDSSIIGSPIEQALPGTVYRDLISKIKSVWATGEVHRANDSPVQLTVDGSVQTLYFDFSYQPLKNEYGKVYAILHTASDVTGRYLSGLTLAESRQKEQQLLEELTAANEELSAINTELVNSQQTLKELNNSLEINIANRTSALAESEAKLRSIFEQSPTAVCVLATRELIIESANENILNIWGKTTDVIGLPLAVALPELEGQVFLKLLDDVFTSGKPYYAYDTKAIQKHNGREVEVYVDFVYSPIEDTGGNIISIMVSAIDVTDKVRIRQREKQLNEEIVAANEELTTINEELSQSQNDLRLLNEELENRVSRRTKALTESEARFRSVVEQSPLGIALLDGPDLIVEIANDNQLKYWGKNRSVRGKPHVNAIDKLDNPFYKNTIGEVYRTGKAYRGYESPATVMHKGELKTRYFNFVYEPLKDEEGLTRKILIIADDVTETVLTRKELERAQDILNLAIEAADIGTWSVDVATDELTMSDRARLSHGIPSGIKLIGRNTSDLIIPEHRERVMNVIAAAVKKGETFDEKFIIAPMDGSELRWIKSMGKAFKDENGRPVYISGTMLDITAQVLYEQQLQVLNEELSSTNEELAAANEELVTSNEEIDLNQRELKKAAEMLRFSIEAANVGTWFLNVETREFIPSGRLKELYGYYASEEMTYEAAINCIPNDYRSIIHHEIENCIQNGANFNVEHPVIGHHDEELRWVRAQGKLYPDGNGHLTHFSGLVIDITDRKLDEQRKDDFISIASHELKTPITSLRASLQLLNRMKENPSPAVMPRLIDQANRSSERVSYLVDDLLNFSKLNQGQLHLNKSKFKLSKVIDDCCSHVRIAGKYDIITEGDTELEVFADPERIDQVIINFVNNAIKYAPDSMVIRITIEKTGDNAKVSVIDKGPGIMAEKLPHLFDRYYRVDTSGLQYSGLGLGLYICSEIIKKHNGQIGVDSEYGKGSSFWFTIPIG